MGQQFSELSTKHIEFIAQQNIYFVSTAAETGKVNLALKSIGLIKINKVLMVLILRLSNAQPCKRNRLQGTA